MFKLSASALALLVIVAAAPADDKPILKKGERLVIVGDSITEQKLYSRYMETYLTACQPQFDLWILQLGWSGETAGGFRNRMDFDLLAFKPGVVTTCYGMNDGGYRAFDKAIGDAYRNNMADIVKRAKAAGAHVVVGSPGAVDSRFFRNGGQVAEIYNDNLAHLRDIAKELAKEHDMSFANVHDAMFGAMPLAKKALGDDYPVCGGDGFHPGPNGQLLMAYAFLKALKPDPIIATITLSLGGTATASDGHKVVKTDGGVVEIESTRYPFCFFGDKKSANSSRSILPFVPFQQDLNRFTLIVKGLKSDKAKVTWGQTSKSFTRDELEKGVNLAAEFDDTPFAAAFQRVDALVGEKQNYETRMLKQYHAGLRTIASDLKDDPQSAAAVTLLLTKMHDKQTQLSEAARKAVVPVKHTIRVEAE